MDIQEIKDEKDLVKRNMLLQKYGVIPPKLTEYENNLIEFENRIKVMYRGADDIHFTRLTMNIPMLGGPTV